MILTNRLNTVRPNHPLTRRVTCPTCGLEYTEVTRLDWLTRHVIGVELHSPRTGHTTGIRNGNAMCECGVDIFTNEEAVNEEAVGVGEVAA